MFTSDIYRYRQDVNRSSSENILTQEATSLVYCFSHSLHLVMIRKKKLELCGMIMNIYILSIKIRQWQIQSIGGSKKAARDARPFSVLFLFDFVQFSGQNFQNNRLVHPFGVSPPSPGKS